MFCGVHAAGVGEAGLSVGLVPASESQWSVGMAALLILRPWYSTFPIASVDGDSTCKFTKIRYYLFRDVIISFMKPSTQSIRG